MRTIKFRAWWNPGDVEVHDKNGTHTEKIEGQIIPWGDFELVSWIKSGGILMQYTGLKDKNGVEIYEGDICIVGDGGEYFPEEYNEKEEEYVACGQYEIVWADHCGFWLNDLKTGRPLDIEYSPFGHAFFEVIGNIYENSELIEVKQ